MARPRTAVRVHEAVLRLAADGGAEALTMEGIAAEAGVGKQTLYRSWNSVAAILFDALLRRGDDGTEDGTEDEAGDVAANAGDPREHVEAFLRAAVDEITAQPHEALLRSIAAKIQTDEGTAREFRERLLRPQLATVHALLCDAGVVDADRGAELLLAPVFYRWFMRLPPMSDGQLREHVSQVFQVTAPPDAD